MAMIRRFHRSPEPLAAPAPRLHHRHGGRRAAARVAQVLVETVVIADLFERKDLSRPKVTLWFSGISRFPRLGTVAYVAARPQTREWLARLRSSAAHATPRPLTHS